MKRMLLSVGIAAVLGWPVMFRPARLGAACAGCHGANGEGIALIPALAGKSQDVPNEGLQIGQARQRRDVSALTDADMTNYYASLKAKC